MASAAAAPRNEEEATTLINANPKHYLEAFNNLKKIAAGNILVTKEFGTYTEEQQNAIRDLQEYSMNEKFMIWYYDNSKTSVCPAVRVGLNFNKFKELKPVSAMTLVTERNTKTHAFNLGGRKKRSRTNRRSRIRRQKRRTSRRY
jgi:hypothetical protein